MNVTNLTFEELKEMFPLKISFLPSRREDQKIPARQSRQFLDDMVLARLASNLNGKQLEIGTWLGGGTKIMAQNNINGIVYTVCPLPHQIEGKIITGVLKKEEIGKEARELKNIRQIYANSKQWKPSEEIKELSFSFIDGCHDADFVKNDTLLCLNLMAKGGVIAWHDFDPQAQKRDHWVVEVTKAVRSFSALPQVFHVVGTWMGFCLLND